MKPRTQAEITDFVYDKLMTKFEGTVPIRREVLTNFLTKILAEIVETGPPPSFEVKVESVDSYRLNMTIEIRDRNLSERLAQLLGRKCPRCGGHGQRKESDGQSGSWMSCYECSGRGVVPL